MKKYINVTYVKTELGELVMGSFDGRVCILDYCHRKKRSIFDDKLKKNLHADFVYREDDVIKALKLQLDEYLSGRRIGFDLPLLMLGTEFQKTVWNELMNIGYGETISYLELASRVGNPKAVRAVAMANAANSLAIVVPCHRVISSDGSIGGYSGGIDIKRKLLDLERR